MEPEKKPVNLQQLANVIGHEIRNPLAVINNSIYFVKTKLGTGVDAKVGKHIGIIEGEVKRANEIIARMLLFGRPFQPAPQPLGVADLVEGLFEGRPAPASVKVVKQGLSGHSPKVSVDREAMTSALRNLLDNSVEAMAEKGGTLTVKAAVSGDAVDLTFSDTGPGLSVEAKARLFEPFFTTKPRGIGLGLAIARKVVEAHRGSLEPAAAASGTAFRVRLPVVR